MEDALIPRQDGVVTGSVAHSGKSAASWPAIIAGAFVAVGTSLILLALGSGLGFASISPWAQHGVSAAAFTVTAAIWLIVTQWISAALGGYIAGRLRTRWIGTHTHEVFFRDTANGLVTWAVATVAVAALVSASVLSMIDGGEHAASGIAATGARGAQGMMSAANSPMAAYGIDKLFRSADSTAGGQIAGDPRAEAGHIMANAISTDNVPDADRTYLAGLIAARSGISQPEAQKRVDDWVSSSREAQAKVKETADTARKAASQASIYTALSLLIGAFIASVSAALGGRLRDEHP